MMASNPAMVKPPPPPPQYKSEALLLETACLVPAWSAGSHVLNLCHLSPITSPSSCKSLSGGATLFRIGDNEFEVDDEIYMRISPLILKVIYWRQHTQMMIPKVIISFPFALANQLYLW
jgi:hypothetical protein